MRPPQGSSRGEAASYSAKRELDVLYELWRLTGYRRDDVPPFALFRAAAWEVGERAFREGARTLRLPVDVAAYGDPPPGPCGVDPFV